MVKFETFDKDSNDIVAAAGLEGFLTRTGGKLSHENPSKAGQQQHRSVQSYLDELSEDLYQPDFDIFG